ncbi:histidinol-phosphate transaminase [Laribacter hongkongensis]|uniref:histidinol-phosphate transaminase n=1 Tax=Laribacter hongkongensis TaxID=168471 RepID=UPI00358DB695
MAATDWVRPEIAELSAYHVAPARDMRKLDAMENPYELPAALRDELAQELAQAALNRYPDPSGGGLKEELAAAFGVPAGMPLLLGNGSDEIITLITQTLARPGATVLSVEPAFVMYRMNAVFSGMRYVSVPLTDEFALDLPAMLAAIEAHQPAVVFVAYPNNPTGPRFARDEVIRIIEAAPGLVVVDEAYAAFADDSFLPDVGRWPNLVVMRTLSKLGLAGIRLGFAAGTPEWISQLDKVRPPYNVNLLTQVTARFALRHLEVFAAQAATLCQERGRLLAALLELSNVRVWPSEANFLTLRLPDARAAFAALQSAGILVKNLHGVHPLLDNCLRLTIGTPDDNAAMLAVLSSMKS